MTSSISAIKEWEDPRLEAARRRIRESVDRADVLDATREIVTNLLGCEEIGLFTVNRTASALFWSFGIDPEQHLTLDVFEKSGIARVLEGEFVVAQTDGNGQGHHATAAVRVFVPIRTNGRTAAVLVMLRLLPQKLDFSETDIKLAKVVSEEIGSCLFSRRTKAKFDHARGTNESQG